MKEQKVVITNSELTINNYLHQGWKIVFQPISQHVSTANAYGGKEGQFCFVIEKENA